ncbi:MAG TPA: class IV adenylate cyclase [Candidatus Acidoferrales bacterium]|nr:class IV adenylate cyclase [Candidatus Acidoferrales bacterium]
MKSLDHREIEIKLRVADVPGLRRRLVRLGLRPAQTGRVFERNTLFDTPQGGLAKHGQLLRLRRIELPHRQRGASKAAPDAALLTYKGPTERVAPPEVAPGRHYKIRQEFETGVSDPDRLQLIFEALGLRGWFRYEKYRTSFELPKSLGWAEGLKVELDETPLGNFLELEGPPAAIDRLAGLLGYRPADYLTRSYLALYLDQCRKQGVPAGDMVFSVRKKAQKKSGPTPVFP